MRQPSARETYMLELVNRARLDPAAEASRLGIGLNQGLAPGTIDAAPKAPLAFDLDLMTAAYSHSTWMLEHDAFAHQGAGGSTPRDRIADAGYALVLPWSVGENIGWSGTTAPTIDLNAAVAAHHDGLFASPGHRTNILSDAFREIGIGQAQGEFAGYTASMVTQNFASSGEAHFLTGVVYDDLNGNRFYDIGEGLPGVTISVDGVSMPAFDSGAYSIALQPGTYRVAYQHPALSGSVEETVTISDRNVKLDVIDFAPDVPDAAAEARTVALLYEAGLGRQPDLPGLNYWIDRRDDGLAVEDMARLLLDSNEFTSRFGDDDLMSDDRFVSVLYDNVLGRDGEAEGQAYWNGAMARGASREAVFEAFAMSDENRLGTAYLDELVESPPGEWML